MLWVSGVHGVPPGVRHHARSLPAVPGVAGAAHQPVPGCGGRAGGARARPRPVPGAVRMRASRPRGLADVRGGPAVLLHPLPYLGQVGDDGGAQVLRLLRRLPHHQHRQDVSPSHRRRRQATAGLGGRSECLPRALSRVLLWGVCQWTVELNALVGQAEQRRLLLSFAFTD